MRKDHQNTLLIEYDGGRTEVDVTDPDKARAIDRALQIKVLQSPPFRTSGALIATHHCFHLLLVHMTYLISPEEPFSTMTANRWLGLLFYEGGLPRIQELFAAEKGDSAKRRRFMRRMQEDWEAYESKMATIVLEDYLTGRPPPLKAIWYDAAEYEMERLGLQAHEGEVELEIWHGAKIKIGCANCQ